MAVCLWCTYSFPPVAFNASLLRRVLSPDSKFSMSKRFLETLAEWQLSRLIGLETHAAAAAAVTIPVAAAAVTIPAAAAAVTIPAAAAAVTIPAAAAAAAARGGDGLLVGMGTAACCCSRRHH